MNLNEKLSTGIYGQISACRIHYRRSDRYSPRKVDHLFTQPNQIQHQWAVIVANLLRNVPGYTINMMYMEFENVATPTDVVSAPVFGKEEGAEYYQNLLLSGVRDFLRVPLVAPPDLGIVPGYEDLLPDGTGNRLTFFSQTQGSTGYHGKQFSDAVNSKVFGVALVAAPDQQDATKDLIFARTYFNSTDQILKLPSSQIGITWNISLT